MKIWFVAILVSLWCSIWASAAWPHVPYTEVRAFAWKSDRAGHTVILPKHRPAKGALQPKGVLLSQPQTALLLEAQARRMQPRPAAMCYTPHHAFIFYQEGKPVAHIEICLDCLGARVSPGDPDCDPDYLLLGELCAELKLPLGRYANLEALRAEVAPILRTRSPDSP